ENERFRAHWNKLKALEVTVTIHKDPGEVYFKAKSPALPSKGLVHTDINELFKMTQEIIQKQHDVLMNAKWEPWLEVHVHRSTNNSNYGGIVSKVEVGVTYSRLFRYVDADG